MTTHYKGVTMTYVPQPMTAAKITMEMLRKLEPTVQDIPADDPVFNEYWVQIAEDEFTMAPSLSELLYVFIFVGEPDELGFAKIEYRP